MKAPAAMHQKAHLPCTIINPFIMGIEPKKNNAFSLTGVQRFLALLPRENLKNECIVYCTNFGFVAYRLARNYGIKPRGDHTA